ncbi:MAG: nitrite reductase/ring-hydroxylating ferredoxin subunit [Myxococcota bacterium]|jgi:nitrite reductase/ring-hydroxylating ferredoxin subunit
MVWVQRKEHTMTPIGPSIDEPASESTTPVWHRAVEAREMRESGRALVRVAGHPVVLFRLPDGRTVALDNRCPHEGYPLYKGELRGEILHCCWHGFQFDLLTGRCIKGDESPRLFPVREVDGWLEVDVAEPGRALALAERQASLEQGLQHNRLGQVARDIARLRRLGMASRDIAMFAARYDAEHAEFGSTHVLAVVADLWPLLDDTDGDLLRLMLPFEMAAEAHIRQPKRPIPRVLDPGEDPVEAGAQLAAAVEAGDVETAEGILRAGLAKGWKRDVIEPWLYRVVADHFLDIGHALIYQVKVFDLLEVAGWEHAIDLLPAHLCRIVQGTREDTLPEWHWFRARVATFLSVCSEAKSDASAERDVQTSLVDVMVAGDRAAAFDAVEQAICSGVDAALVADAMALAAAQRVLDFDPATDLDVTVQDGWLDVTHAFTYAEALAQAVTRVQGHARLRLVAFGIHYVSRLTAICPPYRRAEPTEAAHLDIAGLETRIFNDTRARPIVSAHYFKFVRSARAVFGRTLDPRPLNAAQTLATADIALRRVPRLAHEALRFVVDGKVPKRRT